MSEHTPGPWHVPKHAWFQIVPADGLLGCAAIATVYECVHSGRDKNEAAANANLIATAPELLSEAKEALATLRLIGLGGQVANLEQVIAKAERSSG